MCVTLYINIICVSHYMLYKYACLWLCIRCMCLCLFVVYMVHCIVYCIVLLCCTVLLYCIVLSLNVSLTDPQNYSIKTKRRQLYHLNLQSSASPIVSTCRAIGSRS